MTKPKCLCVTLWLCAVCLQSLRPVLTCAVSCAPAFDTLTLFWMPSYFILPWLCTHCFLGLGCLFFAYLIIKLVFGLQDSFMFHLLNKTLSHPRHSLLFEFSPFLSVVMLYAEFLSISPHHTGLLEDRAVSHSSLDPQHRERCIYFLINNQRNQWHSFLLCIHSPCRCFYLSLYSSVIFPMFIFDVIFLTSLLRY